MSHRNHTLSILVFACVAHALTHIYTILHTPLLAHMGRDFGMGIAEVAFFFTLLNVCFGFGAIPAGWLSDRFGEKLMLTVFFFGCAVGGAMIGFARTSWLLGSGAIVLGLATSIYHPAGTALISKGVARRGRAMGINGIAGSAGTALGPVIAAVVAYEFSWRVSYIALAVPSVAFGLWLCASDLGPSARGGRGRNASPAPQTRMDRTRRQRLLVVFTLLLLAMTLGGFFYHLVTTILPQHIEGAVGALAPESAESFSGRDLAGGLKAGLALTFGAVGQLVAGLLCDRFDKRRLYILNYITIVPLIYLLGHAQGSWILFFACGSSLFFFGVQPIENTLIADYTPASWRGLVYGAKFVLVFAVGGTGTWVAARVLREHGSVRVFDIATLVACGALVCAILAAGVRLGHRRAESASSSAEAVVTPGSG